MLIDEDENDEMLNIDLKGTIIINLMCRFNTFAFDKNICSNEYLFHSP